MSLRDVSMFWILGEDDAHRSFIRGWLGANGVLAPRRHIETWVHALGPTSPQVNEQADYKHKTIEEVKSAARRLARLPSAPVEPPSLVHGYEQLQRLKGA